MTAAARSAGLGGPPRGSWTSLARASSRPGGLSAALFTGYGRKPSSAVCCGLVVALFLLPGRRHYPETRVGTHAQSRRHSGLRELGSGRQIELLLEAESLRTAVWHQSQIRLPAMPLAEAERWGPPEGEEGLDGDGSSGSAGSGSAGSFSDRDGSCGSRRLVRLLILGPASLVARVLYSFACFACALAAVSACLVFAGRSDAVWVSLVCLPLLLCVCLEVMVRRARPEEWRRQREDDGISQGGGSDSGSGDDGEIRLKTKASRRRGRPWERWTGLRRGRPQRDARWGWWRCRDSDSSYTGDTGDTGAWVIEMHENPLARTTRRGRGTATRGQGGIRKMEGNQPSPSRRTLHLPPRPQGNVVSHRKSTRLQG